MFYDSADQIMCKIYYWLPKSWMLFKYDIIIYQQT